MTDKKDCMTMEQAEQKMECLREVFSIVRLVDGEMLEKRAEHSADADVMEMCQCYSFWNKAKPCENCISMKSLREKKQAAKLEFLDSDIFQVFSRYVEIDGKPYVMEMLKKLDEDTLLAVFEGVPQFEVSKDAVAAGVKAVDLFTENAAVFASKGEMRKLVQGGGVSLNKEKLEAFDQVITSADLLDEKYLLVQRGKKNYYLIIAK